MVKNLDLVLGCAQFSERYGFNSSDYGITFSEKKSILEIAQKYGICKLDTANAYGCSERVLGELGVESFKVNTKLPANLSFNSDASILVNKWFSETISKLNITTLNNIFFHRPDQLCSSIGEKVYEQLINLKASNSIRGVGVSVNKPDELYNLLKHYDFDIVQIPYNIFDNRFSDLDLKEKLYASSTTVQARSIFLQGVLLQEFSDLPNYFSNWEEQFKDYELAVREKNCSKLIYCLSFIARSDFVDEVVVGCQSSNQLNDIINASRQTLSVDHGFNVEDLNLVMPSNWRI